MVPNIFNVRSYKLAAGGKCTENITNWRKVLSTNLVSINFICHNCGLESQVSGNFMGFRDQTSVELTLSTLSDESSARLTHP